MSLIYKSIDKLRREDAGAGAGVRHTSSIPGSRDGKMRGVILVLALLLVVGGVAAFFGADYLREQSGLGGAPTPSVAQAPETMSGQQPEPQANQQPAQQPAAEPAPQVTVPPESMTEPVRQAAQPEPQAQAEPMTQATGESMLAPGEDINIQKLRELVLSKAEDRPTIESPAAAAEARKPLPKVLENPSEPLERHFSSRAKKNVAVQKVESALTNAVMAGDMQSAKNSMAELEKSAGEKSLSYLKWQGFLALKEDRPDAAEELFRKALVVRPMDFESQYNLVIALMKQDKMVQAKNIFDRLHKQHPLDARVQHLKQQLTAALGAMPS